MKPTRIIHVGPEFPLAEAFKEQRRPGTLFQVQPGVHLLPGVWAYDRWVAMESGCDIVGQGESPTEVRLRLSPDAERTWAGAPQGDRSLNPLWVGKGCRVENLTIDGNESAFRASDWYVPSGLRSIGGGLTARRLRITGLRGAYSAPGTKAGAIEAFGISTEQDTAGGNIIEDIEFDGIPANSYFSAVYVGSQRGAQGETPERSVVRRVRSQVGRGNWFLIAAGVNVEFEDISGSGHRIAVYNDTVSTEEITIRRLTATGISKALSLVDKDGTDKAGIRVEDSEFTFAGQDRRYAVELWDQSGTPERASVLGFISFRGCRFLSAGRTPFYGLSVAARGYAGVEFLDCQIPARALLSQAAETPAEIGVAFQRCTTPIGSPFPGLVTS
jgi:hypothetical protein